METNRHHLYFTRRTWDAFRLSNEIRNDPQSIQEMYVPVHNELHHYIRPIEPPAANVARIILSSLHQVPARYDALETAKSLVQDLWDTEASEYADHLDRQIPFMELSRNAMMKRRV